MDDPYGLPAEFRHFTATTTRPDHHQHDHPVTNFPAEPSFSVHRNLTPPFPLVSGGGLVEFGSDNHDHHHGHHIAHHDHHQLISGATSCALMYGHHDQTVERCGGIWNNNNSSIGGNIIMDGNNEGNNSRWPRQETLTLLEIRSRLNSKFKDTNQKAPLWDEVSRIMAEEHGYHRSGKKCKEKFENLYKYYKKTKEGKAGRQDGKHYRFFRQLEAIYGDQTSNIKSSSLLLNTNDLSRNPLLYDHPMTSTTSTPNLNMRTTNINHESLSFSITSTEFETSSSENNNEDDLSTIANFKMKMKGGIINNERPSRNCSLSWKSKVEDFVDEQMKKIMVTQETWMEKMLKSIIDKEEERLVKEEEWRKQEAAKFNQEVSEFWAKEKAWVEARDVALMGTLKKFRAGKGIELPSFPERVIGKDHIRSDMSSCASYHRWSEEEISSLIELRSKYNMEETFQGGLSEYVKDGIWEEIASKMASLGYDRTSLECKEKWESASVYVRMTSECRKKRKEDYYKSSAAYFDDDHDDQLNLKQEHNIHDERHNIHDHMGLQLMDEGLSPSTSNVGTQLQYPNSCFHLLFGEGENLWEKYGGLKLTKDKMNRQVYNK
ncbi:Trihelix transcription factor GT-2 [Morus notabilis]|uniref:Trihelix transcription factor GT-2 n=2 Tax=Morus notabilis TaxID=981085 RepID=W9S4E4_9ROSA|nr:Trihelix transcription factor GT-2 [Morus notabilis]